MIEQETGGGALIGSSSYSLALTQCCPAAGLGVVIDRLVIRVWIAPRLLANTVHLLSQSKAPDSVQDPRAVSHQSLSGQIELFVESCDLSPCFILV